MKNKKIAITAILLMIAIGNYYRIIFDGNIRTVEFISIFVIGTLTGVLLAQIFKKYLGENYNQ
jgi:hypothetical protein